MLSPSFKIIVSSTNLFSLQVYVNFICKILKIHLNPLSIHTSSTKTTRVTLLKSPHVYKKSKEQYSIKKYRTTILSNVFFYNNVLFKFVLLNKPKSIALNFVLEK